MKEWIEFAQPVGIGVASLGAFFWWATTKLIPQLQKERSDAIAAFERSLDKVTAKCEERENRLFNITESILPEMMKSISSHNQATISAIESIDEANRRQREEHLELLKAMTGSGR